MPLEADRFDLLLQKITDMDNKMELKFDLLTGKIAELQQIATNVTQIQQDVTDLRSNVSVANTEIKRLKHEVEDLQREKTSKQIIFDNIPQIAGEDIGAILRQILSVIGCPTEIFPEVAYRLGKYNPNKERPPPILADFRNSFIRNSIIAQWKKQKMLFTDQICSNNFGLPRTERRKIYINKNYSPSIRALLQEARTLKKHGYKIVYEYKNEVYVKQSLAHEPIKVSDFNFVQELLTNQM
jgi:hypothetical protein